MNFLGVSLLCVNPQQTATPHRFTNTVLHYGYVVTFTLYPYAVLALAYAV